MFRGELGMVPLLHELLGDKSPQVRARSALILGQIACPSSTEPLAAALTDPERAVRVAGKLARYSRFISERRREDTATLPPASGPSFPR